MALPETPRSKAFNALQPKFEKPNLKTREEILKGLGIEAPKPQVYRYKEPNNIKPYVYSPPPPKKGGGGFLGALGDVISIIDKPRALIVSTIKETGDLLSGEGFSASDWWNQVGDNMMMGEVLRDWGVDLPGPLDFVVGLGLDIALDPLTYLTGGAIAARYTNPKRVADALGEASKIYRAAGNVTKADDLLKAQGRVLSKGSVLSAGDDALKAVGMRVGIGFTLPGTGRISRSIIERPLRKLDRSGNIGRYLDGRRVKQLPEANLPEFMKGKNNPWLKNGERSYDFSKTGNINKAVTKIANIRANKAAKATAFSRPARQAMRMPVQTKFYIPGSANFVKVSAGLFGAAFGATAATKFGQTMSKMMGTQGDYNQAVRNLGKEMSKGNQDALNAYDYLRVAYKGASTANSEVIKWQHYTLENLKDLRVQADELGIDFNKLIYNYAEEPFEVSVPALGPQLDNASGLEFAANPKVVDAMGNTPEARALHKAAQDFWENAGKRLQKQLEPYGVKVDLIDFKDEFYVPRYLNEVDAEDIVAGVTPKKDLLTINQALGMSNSSGLVGQMSKIRMYAPTSRIRKLRKAAEGRPAVQAGLVPFEEAITDDMIIKAARKNNVDLKSEFGTARPMDEVFEELLNLPTGVVFEYADSVGYRGSRITNRYLGQRLEDVGTGGSIRQQMDDIGKQQLGDDYKNIFVRVEDGDDVQKAVQKYINQSSALLRERMFLATLDNAGVTVNIPGRLQVAKAMSKGKQVPFFGFRANTLNNRMERLLGSGKKKIDQLTARVAREQDILERYAARLAEFEEAVAKNPDGVSAMAKQEAENFNRLNAEVAEAQRQIDEIRSFMNVLLDPNATKMPDEYKMSLDVFELLRPPSAKPGAGDRLFISSLVDHAQYLKNSEQAGLAINDIAETVNSLTTLRQAIVDVLNAIDGQSATKAQFKSMLDELDEAIVAGKSSVEALNLNWMDNTLQEPGVLTAHLFKQLSDEVVKDTAYKITRNGRKISRVNFVTPVQRELKNLTKRMKTAARVAAKKDPDTAKQILDDVRTIDDWVEQVSELRKLQKQLGEGRLYSGSLAAIKNIEEGIVLIRDVSGITAIDDQIREIEQLIKNTTGINDLDGPSQEMLTKLIGKRQQLLDANEANIAALQDITDEWKRKMANLKAKFDAKQITVDELNEQIAMINQKHTALSESIQAEIQMGKTEKQLSTRMAYITDQEEAIKELSKARSQNTLFDAYGGALNDFLLKLTPISSRGPLGNTRNLKSARAIRAFEGKAFVGEFDDDTVELLANAMAALGKIQDPDALSSFWKGYDTFLNYWKAQAVTSPGFFMRNQLGGMWINNQINEVPMYQHARVREIRKIANAKGNGNVLRGLRLLIEEGNTIQLKGPIRRMGGPQNVDLEELRIFREWYETGVAGQGQVTQEIQTTLDQLGAVRGSAWRQGSMKPWRADWKPMNWVRARNSDSEFMLRGALAHNNMMAGDTLEDAVAAVTKYHFDYGDLSAFERKVKKVIPFWTWQRNILPILVESIGKNPKAWARLQQVKEELELTSPMENMVPHYFGENMGIRLPFTHQGNRVYVMPDLPFRDMQKITKDMESIYDVKGGIQGLGRIGLESALPPVKLPIELMLGKQVFGGIPFSDRYQQAPIWANAPVIKEALLLTGLAKKSKGGDIVMTDKDIYSVDQFLPLIGRLRRLVPNEGPKQDAVVTTWMNTFLGTGLRINTPASKRSEFIRRQREAQKALQDIIDIELRQR